MAYIVDTLAGEKAQAYARERVGFSPEVVSKTIRLVWEGSSFTDPGPDWNRFTAFDEAGHVLATKTIDGY